MSSSEPVLTVERLSASWDGRPVLHDISFALAHGEFLVLLGPNGSGKTTLLRTLIGLERPTSGRVAVEGEEVPGRPDYRRGLGLMFQEPALFPHRTVYENIAYAPLLAHRPRSEVLAEVDRLVSLVRLEGLEDRRPDELSGGERQRTALARTLAARPRVVLLDEPFASIDVELRGELHAEFRRVLRASGTAAIHVTHDRREGLFLGDRVGLLFDGRLETVDPPAAVYRNPRSARAARFLGYNVLPGPRGLEAVHPSDLVWGAIGEPGVPATVLRSGTAGRGALAIVRDDSGERFELEGEDELALLRPGDRGTLRWERGLVLTG